MPSSSLRNGFAHSVTIKAPCAVVLNAFVDHDALSTWWHIKRSLCVPRTLGCYAIEWETAADSDPVLGRLGGVFHGTVMTFDSQRELFVADAYWMAPDGEPLGPIAFEVTCTTSPDGTIVHVRQSGSDTGERWSRYYEMVRAGLEASLQRLKTMLEA
jgi:uncharacterized protein YndB with AHSA1/START domain